MALQPLPETPRDEVANPRALAVRRRHGGQPVAGARRELRLDPQAQGVVITAVADGSTAQSIGFRPGDIVVTVNNEKIARSADLDHIANSGSHSWRITIQRGNQQISVMFSG